MTSSKFRASVLPAKHENKGLRLYREAIKISLNEEARATDLIKTTQQEAYL